MAVWTVYVLSPAIEAGAQLDIIANSVVQGVPVPPMAVADKLDLVFPNNSRAGGIVIDPDETKGVIELDGGPRWSIRKATSSDNIAHLGTYTLPCSFWFVGTHIP